ncbi:TIR domain-containing protein [Catelliglobosispora koreensis]|uniref:TIR domain-containing protein n=1 Tax=Catelliglobosispora koreensis TaxID=129052 RepID=UPI0003A4BE59|nr:TIR domain-containing protein [Catelliglobosispora koreensis]
MGGHVFISYSRRDRHYVDKLATHLSEANVTVWYDYEMAAGQRFGAVIQQQIDECAVFIVVLTPEAAGSKWVGRELSYAEAHNKPIVPLLLEPCRVPIEVADLHHEDVTNGEVPSSRFLARLRQLLPAVTPPPPAPQQPARSPQAATARQAPAPLPVPAQPKEPLRQASPGPMPGGSEPSTMVSRYLFPTEKLVGEYRISVLSHPVLMAALILATALLIVLITIGMFVLPGILFWSVVTAWAVIRFAVTRSTERLVVTDKRVMLLNGVIERRVSMIPTTRLTDAAFEQSALGRVFDFGTFTLEAAGEAQALRRVEYVKNPYTVYLSIMETIYHL